MVVEFVFGLGSRYSYLASTQLGRIRQATGCGLLWTPVSSVELMELRGQKPFLGAPVSGQYDREYRRRTWRACVVTSEGWVPAAWAIDRPQAAIFCRPDSVQSMKGDAGRRLLHAALAWVADWKDCS